MNEKEIKQQYYDLLTKVEKTINPTIRSRYIKEATDILHSLRKDGKTIKGLNSNNN